MYVSFTCQMMHIRPPRIFSSRAPTGNVCGPALALPSLIPFAAAALTRTALTSQNWSLDEFLVAALSAVRFSGVVVFLSQSTLRWHRSPTVQMTFWRSESAVPCSPLSSVFDTYASPYNGSRQCPDKRLGPIVHMRQISAHAEQESACLLMSCVEAIRHQCCCPSGCGCECTKGAECSSNV